MTVLLTGATGHLGSHITEHAIKEQVPDFNIGIRNPDKMPSHWKDKVGVRELDYFNEESMVRAFKGIDTVIFIPSIIHPSFKRLPEVENLVSELIKYMSHTLCLLDTMQINIIILSI